MLDWKNVKRECWTRGNRGDEAWLDREDVEYVSLWLALKLEYENVAEVDKTKVRKDSIDNREKPTIVNKRCSSHRA